MLTNLTIATEPSEFAADVCQGLTKKGQRELPSKYLYDSIGSALFEVICLLPEYGVTRAEERLLARHSGEIVCKLASPVVVAELGSGTGKKTRLILEALCRKRATSYHPIEISPSALAFCRRELQDIPSISIVGFEREYLDGLLEVTAIREEGQQLLVLFLGSTIGNFDGTASTDFLRRVREILREGDALLLGADMTKPVETLIAAYDDGPGVTAAFNLNLLARINRELGGNFNLAQFQHLAVYNEGTRSIEMHLRSRREQRITISQTGLSLELRAGETIWTETSHKYSFGELESMAEQSGFRSEAQWVDRGWAFAENLWVAV